MSAIKDYSTRSQKWKSRKYFSMIVNMILFSYLCLSCSFIKHSIWDEYERVHDLSIYRFTMDLLKGKLLTFMLEYLFLTKQLCCNMFIPQFQIKFNGRSFKKDNILIYIYYNLVNWMNIYDNRIIILLQFSHLNQWWFSLTIILYLMLSYLYENMIYLSTGSTKNLAKSSVTWIILAYYLR